LRNDDRLSKLASWGEEVGDIRTPVRGLKTSRGRSQSDWYKRRLREKELEAARTKEGKNSLLKTHHERASGGRVGPAKPRISSSLKAERKKAKNLGGGKIVIEL